MQGKDFLQHIELDTRQETKRQLLQGLVQGACEAAVVIKNCVAKEYCTQKPSVLNQGELVQVFSCHQQVRLCRVNEEPTLQLDERCLICSEVDIAIVPENVWPALFPVPPRTRVRLVTKSKLVDNLATLRKGSAVEISDAEDRVVGIGVIEHRGEVPGLKFGIYFGIRVIDAADCLTDLALPTPYVLKDFFDRCDILVTIDKIRPTTRTTIDTIKYKSSVSMNVADHQQWMTKSASHHSFRTTGDAVARRQASRSLDSTAKIPNHLANSMSNSQLTKVHSSSKSLELPENNSRRLVRGRACASLDSDIPVQKKANENGGDDSGGDELTEESLVEILDADQLRYGVIRRIYRNGEKVMADVEMEDDYDEDFCENEYLTSPVPRNVCVPLACCRRDSRFQDKSNRRNTSANGNSFGLVECPVVEGVIPPITANFKEICRKNRGIQGHHNSCYLDATLFSMFAFTSVFDSILYRPRAHSDIPEYEEVQRVLREEIVNPLRKNVYVRADRVMKLRTLLDQLSSVSGLTSEEKDPEEFLNSLLTQILKAEPFLVLSSDQKAFHYQLFVEKDPSLVLPSVQQLLEQSFTASDIKLKQLPSCLIVQMPRFGKAFKMYPRIVPATELDVTDVIQDSPRQCTSCGKLAEVECKDCYISGLEGSSFCLRCIEIAHSHFNRNNHKMRQLTIPVEFAELQEHCVVPRLIMNLFAVVCIETSHYVTFLNTAQGWVFFDSMADRKGEQNGYNIPEIVHCPELEYWLSEDGARKLLEQQDDRELPELAKRLLCDAYMCMYQSPDVMMYK